MFAKEEDRAAPLSKRKELELLVSSEKSTAKANRGYVGLMGVVLAGSLSALGYGLAAPSISNDARRYIELIDRYHKSEPGFLLQKQTEGRLAADLQEYATLRSNASIVDEANSYYLHSGVGAYGMIMGAVSLPIFLWALFSSKHAKKRLAKHQSQLSMAQSDVLV
ncbi:MAG TPA: hypothetical protein VJC07_04630 [Candidatus Nanoarchaeia archaeon]|nr:hypothetical protein [Candidatus Nanoarchaeia archaeon]